MSDLPLVSVFLPTYNQQAYIRESIDSVIKQDYDNIEIVIGDDCSKDDTWQIVQEYQQQFPGKIKAFRNPVNLGITGNCSEVLRRCTGKYVVFTAGDDLFMEGKIHKQVALMEADASMVLSYHDVEVFNSADGKMLRFWNKGPLSSPPLTGSAEAVAKQIIVKGTSFMAALSVMVRREAIPESGYDMRVPVASDWLMWIEVLARAGKRGKVGYLPDVLARYRRHDANISGQDYKHTADQLVTLAIVEDRYPRFVSAVNRGIARSRYARSVRMILSGESCEGRRLMLKSLCIGWVSWKAFYWLGVSYLSSHKKREN